MQTRFNVLDSFRGLSAIFVVLFHLRLLGSLTELEFFRGSGLFVEFFFVLSGFVLTHGYAFKKELNFKAFLISRTFRLMPLHITILLVFILLEFGKLYAYNHGFSFNAKPFTGDAAVSDIFPNLLLLQAWLPNTTTLSWNYPSWSISIEYYMYMIFFLSLLVKSKLRYLLWFALSFVGFIFLFNNSEVGTEILRGISCFFAGSLTYLIYRNINDKVKVLINKNYFIVIEIILLFAVIHIISSDYEYRSLIGTVLFNIVVFVFAFERGIVSKLLSHKVFLYLGKLSYSIYMLHAVVLFLVLSLVMIVEKITHTKLAIMVDSIRVIDFGSLFYNNLFILAVLGIIVFLAGFTYKYIELKGQELGKRLNNN